MKILIFLVAMMASSGLIAQDKNAVSILAPQPISAEQQAAFWQASAALLSAQISLQKAQSQFDALRSSVQAVCKDKRVLGIDPATGTLACVAPTHP